MVFLELFWQFFKIGLFAIGGGMATIPFLKALSASSGWYSIEELMDLIAVSESTPGPLGINMASYVGYKVGYGEFGAWGGIIGSVVAVLGEVAPSIIIILIVAYFYVKFRRAKTVEWSFYGLRPASAALICAAGYSVMLLAIFDTVERDGPNAVSIAHTAVRLSLAALIGVILYVRPRIHPLMLIGFSAVLGIALGM